MMTTLPGFKDVDRLLPHDEQLRIAVTLLVLQAYSAGQQDGMARSQDAVERVLARLKLEVVPKRDAALQSGTAEPT